MSKILATLFIPFVFLFASNAVNAEAPSADGGMTAEQFLATLKFQHGKITLPNNIATLDMPSTFRYLDPADTERILVNAWGNPPGSKTLGMNFPLMSARLRKIAGASSFPTPKTDISRMTMLTA